MRQIFAALSLSAIAIWLISAVAMAICGLVYVGMQHPQYGIPGLVFLWMAIAWFIHWADKN